MFSKLRYLNQSASARGSLCRAKTCLDKTAIVIRDTHHVTGSCFFCQDYQKKNDSLCEPNGTYLSCQHVNKTSSGHLGARLPWEITKCHVKREISAVKHSQLRRSNLHQRTQGTIAGLERGLLRLRKSEHVNINNIVQSHFFSTTSARSFVAPSAVLQKTDTDKGSSWISKIKTAISGKEEADKSFHTEDPVKIIYDKEKPLVIIHGKETPVLETDAVVAEDESFWPLLRGCDTIEEVLTLMGPKIEQKELDIDQYLEVLHKLQMIIYTSLPQQYGSWQGDEMVPDIFVKLLLNDSRLSEFEFLGKSYSFQRLQDNLVQLIPEMTAAQFTSCLSGFMWLGVDSTSSTIVTFISHLDDFPYKEFTVSTLHILSVCLMSLPRPDVLIVKNIYPRLKALIEAGNEIDPDRKNLFSLIFLGHVNIPDIDIGIWLSKQILKIAETTDNLKDPFLASWCLKFCSDVIKFMKDSDHGDNLINSSFVSHSHSKQLLELASAKDKLTDLVIINLMDVCDSLMGNDVARIAGSAFKMGIYGLPWADVIKQRSLDLFFDETLPISQRMPALTGLTGCVDMDNETRQKIESVILTIIDDADVLNTSHILHYVGHLNADSPALVAVCEKKIVQTFDKMVEYKILSQRLFAFLANCAMQDEDKHLYLQSKMADIKFDHASIVLKYIISQKSWLDTSSKVLAVIAEFIGSCSLRNYIRAISILFIDGFKWPAFKKRLKSEGNWKGETIKAVLSFEKNVDKRYYKALETNDELDYVLYLSAKIVNIRPAKVYLKTLTRSVEKATEKMPLNSKRLRRLITILSRMPVLQDYVSRTIVDRVLSALDQWDDVTKDDMSKLTSVLQKWITIELEDVTAPLKDKIQDVLGRKLDLLTENQGLVRTVYNIESLCILGIFPEAALRDLLNVDTMAKLDEIIESSDDKTLLVQNLSKHVTEDMLKGIFLPAEVVEIGLAKDDNGLCVGFGFVLFDTIDTMEEQLKEKQRAILGGQKIFLINYTDTVTMKNSRRFYIDSSRIKKALVTINRCVMIDKGDMKIPWFMGAFTEEQRKLLATDVYKDKQRRQNKQMCQILGKGNFAAEWEAECGYVISFACLVDKDNNLLPFKAKLFKVAKQLGLQRVAVEFTSDSHQTGSTILSSALKKKHLKKLGYRVVEVNDREFLPMAWSSPQERRAYYRKKILGQLSEELTQPKYTDREEELVETNGDHYANKDL